MKVVFWNVDTQKDFMNKDGALYVEGAESIKPNLKILTEFAKDNDITVINTRDIHLSSHEEISDNPDFVNTFPEHCMNDGTDGMDYIEETDPTNEHHTILDYGIGCPLIDVEDRNIVINKKKFDVFEGNPHTDKFLEFINPDVVVIYGVATNVCVNQAVLGLDNRGYNLLVVEDAIKELPNLPLKDIFDEWDQRDIIRITTKQIVEHIDEVLTWAT